MPISPVDDGLVPESYLVISSYLETLASLSRESIVLSPTHLVFELLNCLSLLDFPSNPSRD